MKNRIVGQRFLIIPSGKDRAPVNETERLMIYLLPGRAFGGGDHETTISVLEEMELIPNWAGRRILDAGCGTGILTIAAARLGAGEVVAIDIEHDAVEETRQNINLNQLTTAVTILKTDVRLVSKGQFDIILANLYGEILVEISQTLANLLNAGGIMILSGITYEHVYDVKKSFTDSGLNLIRSRALEKYCTLTFARNQRA